MIDHGARHGGTVVSAMKRSVRSGDMPIAADCNLPSTIPASPQACQAVRIVASEKYCLDSESDGRDFKTIRRVLACPSDRSDPEA